MKNICESLREYAMEIINLKKKMKLLTKEQQKWYQNAKISYIYNKKIMINLVKIKNVVKLEIVVITQGL